MLKKLEGAGFVVRGPDPEDGRGSLVELTRRGLDLQSRVLNAFVSAAENRLGDARGDERARLDEALMRWTEILER
jgi:DNA-binding MarR family transcriptional regulator